MPASALSLRGRAAQLVVAPASNFNAAKFRPVVRAGVGGLLLLGAAPSNLAQQLAAARQAVGAGVPPLVMADEEGGGVQRLNGLVGDIPWPRRMADRLTRAQVERLASTVGREMRALGVDVDLAPVLDVDGAAGPTAQDPDGRRSFSASPTRAARYGIAFARGLARGGVLAVAKHFPGLGGASGNTDDGPATTLDRRVLRREGIPPFRAAIAEHVPAVMVANAAVPGLTAAPASLSATLVTSLLRVRLGFNGLVLTDSLSASAIAAAGYSVPRAAAAAINAGADMVLFGSSLTAHQRHLLTPTNVERTTHRIIRRIDSDVRNHTISRARLDQAVTDVLRAKAKIRCNRLSD